MPSVKLSSFKFLARDIHIYLTLSLFGSDYMHQFFPLILWVYLLKFSCGSHSYFNHPQ